MTHVKPGERLSAAKVLDELDKVDNVEADFVPEASNSRTANVLTLPYPEMSFLAGEPVYRIIQL